MSDRPTSGGPAKRYGGGMGLLPLPEHRRRRVLPLMIAGVVLWILAEVLDVGFAWGLGVGLVLASAFALLLDYLVRRRSTHA